jgi:hypothetical protein
MEFRIAYHWKPLEDLPSDWPGLAVAELRVLSEVWEEQREKLEELESLREFNERLAREWAIETGIIERVYDLDRGVTQLLIEKGIDASLIPYGSTGDRDPELVAAMIRDHHAVVDGLFSFVKGDRQLSTSYIKEVHAALTRHQATSLAVDTLGIQREVPLLRGDYKKYPNNPIRPDGGIHEYCPPEHVAAEMDRLLEMHHRHRDPSVPPEVEAAWLHHRFTQIHPFQDGNGRVARCLATLTLLKAGWFPLVVTRDDRQRYIRSLEVADAGDLRELVLLIVALERKAFVNALTIAGDVLRREKVQQIIDAVRDELIRRREAIREEWEHAKDTARELQDSALHRLEELVTELKEKVGLLSPDFAFFVDSEPPGGGRHDYFRYQIIEAAKRLGYFANTGIYHGWCRLVLKTEGQAEIVVSFHGIGHEYRGVLVVSTSFFRREETSAEGEREVADIFPLCDEIFQVNYRESTQNAKSRFEPWLESALVKGLEFWRRGV